MNEYKYYKGEISSPYPKNSTEDKFWYGEMMFEKSNQSIGYWERYAKRILKELRDDNQIKILHHAESLPLRNFAIVLYIEELFSKHCPMDDIEWIYNY